MCKLRPLILLSLLYSAALVSAQGSTNVTSRWQTLSGNAPLVIANGGFSGLFPHSSTAAYSLAIMTSLSNVNLWCDVQLTKDEAGICFPDINLQNASDVATIFKNRKNTYSVNGVTMQGWFPNDFTLTELGNVILYQGVYSRTGKFDGNLFQILTVQDMVEQLKPPGLWLNIQHDAFYTQQNLSMRNFVLSVSRSVIVGYISSPEVAFLRSISKRFSATKTKLVFRFLERDEVEPTTNETYDSLLSNLTFIKSFASGILVPKGYIWPVDTRSYLQPQHTSVVQDAHKEGLEVFGSEFINDIPFSYNYSYDPKAEVLNFIDNGDFSVDGVLSDFPITPSAAIDCFAHIGKNASGQDKPLIISFNGASGDYPSSTDVAYTQAISDGADVIDCNVQMTEDGVPICLRSINLIDSTKVAQTQFSNLATNIPEIQSNNGIFTFNLTWMNIRNLTPAISNPYSNFRLIRNPAYANTGKLVSLSEFLGIAKEAKSLSGVLISIENAVFLAKAGLGIIDVVLDALSKAGYDSGTAPKVMIQSTNSAVLKEFKERKNYELVYKVDENIRDASDATIDDIKQFASSMVVNKESVYPLNSAFIVRSTDIVSRLQKNNLSVYVETFDNEFVSQAWDFFSDATVEINSFAMGAGIDGVITSFPKTSAAYKKNRCLKYKEVPAYMSPVDPGSLMQVITSAYLPPAEAPYPLLEESDVVQPPIPEVSAISPPSGSSGGTTASPAPASPNGQPKIAACMILSNLALLLVTLLLL